MRIALGRQKVVELGPELLLVLDRVGAVFCFHASPADIVASITLRYRKCILVGLCEGCTKSRSKTGTIANVYQVLGQLTWTKLGEPLGMK